MPPLTAYSELQDFRREQMGGLGLRVFTTFRANFEPGLPLPAILHLDYHVERLLASVRSLGILPEIPAVADFERRLRSAISSLYRHRSLPDELSVRVVASEEGFSLCASPFQTLWPVGSTIKLRSFQLQRALPEHKTTSAAVSVLAHRDAAAAGADEALLISDEGLVREGAWSNIFWFDRSGALFTSKSSVLPGVTRRILQQLVDCHAVDLAYDEFLTTAAEIFITQSTTGLTPVMQVDDRSFATGENFQRISQIFTNYQRDKLQ